MQLGAARVQPWCFIIISKEKWLELDNEKS